MPVERVKNDFVSFVDLVTFPRPIPCLIWVKNTHPEIDTSLSETGSLTDVCSVQIFTESCFVAKRKKDIVTLPNSDIFQNDKFYLKVLRIQVSMRVGRT